MGKEARMMRKVLLSALLLSSALCAGAEGSTAVNINTTTSAVSAQPLTPIQKGEALIQKLTQNQAVIDQTFTTENGWIGYVVRPAQSLRGAILYTDATGSYLFAGNLVNSDGQNLTQAYTEEYVNSKLATQAAALVGDLNWIQQGQDSAPHKAYIVLDPNCIYCHLLFQELQPVIEQGNLQPQLSPGFPRQEILPGLISRMGSRW
ncbi:MAG: hypothetical protein EBX40_03380 [Gammaproteobacteria bacterium]|nr:hypothetical protein [Gammaproteobacteria bacterium]